MMRKSSMTLPDAFTRPDYHRAALITIDVQNDALDGGAFEVPGTSAILPRIADLCRTFRHAGRPIVHVIRIYTPDAVDADRCRRSALLAGKRILLKGVGRASSRHPPAAARRGHPHRRRSADLRGHPTDRQPGGTRLQTPLGCLLSHPPRSPPQGKRRIHPGILRLQLSQLPAGIHLPGQ